MRIDLHVHITDSFAPGPLPEGAPVQVGNTLVGTLLSSKRHCCPDDIHTTLIRVSGLRYQCDECGVDVWIR